MKLLANSSKIQYAVIRASSTHDSRELLVIAYADEKSLRSLIAEPSIVALGFASRSDAYAAVAGRFHQSVANQQMRSMLTQRSGNQSVPFRLHSGKSSLTDLLTRWKAHSVVDRAVQFTFTTAILVFYSRNILSATIRMALGV